MHMGGAVHTGPCSATLFDKVNQLDDKLILVLLNVSSDPFSESA